MAFIVTFIKLKIVKNIKLLFQIKMLIDHFDTKNVSFHIYIGQTTMLNFSNISFNTNWTY